MGWGARRFSSTSTTHVAQAAAPTLGGVMRRMLPVFMARAPLGVATIGLAVGAAAFGAVAVGSLAVGALAVGRVRLQLVQIERLEVGELTVRRLRVEERMAAEGAEVGEPQPQG